MARYSMKQRISYNQGVAKAGGIKGARAKGYLQGVKDAQTASRIAKARAARKASEICENCGGKKK